MSEPNVSQGGAPPQTSQRLVVGVVDDPSFDQHIPPAPHPERPERLFAARRAIVRSKVGVRPLSARDAPPEALERVHDPRYLEELGHLAGRAGHVDADTYLAPGSVE